MFLDSGQVLFEVTLFRVTHPTVFQLFHSGGLPLAATGTGNSSRPREPFSGFGMLAIRVCHDFEHTVSSREDERSERSLHRVNIELVFTNTLSHHLVFLVFDCHAIIHLNHFLKNEAGDIPDLDFGSVLLATVEDFDLHDFLFLLFWSIGLQYQPESTLFQALNPGNFEATDRVPGRRKTES